MKKENWLKRHEHIAAWGGGIIALFLLIYMAYSYVKPQLGPETTTTLPMPVSNAVFRYRIKHPVYGGVITERADWGCEKLPCNITTNFIVNTTEFPLDEGDVLNLTWTGMLERKKEGLIIYVFCCD